MSGRKTSPMTASDAARLAAQQSKRGKMTLALGENQMPSQEQQSVLAQIARGLGPKASGPQMAGPAPTLSQQGYPPPAYNSQPAGSLQGYEQGRAPNRRRR